MKQQGCPRIHSGVARTGRHSFHILTPHRPLRASVVAPLCTNTSKNPPRPQPPLPRLRRQPRKNRLAPSAHPLPQPNQHTARPPPAISSDRPLTAAASRPRNRHVMPESRKHRQERPITNRSGQQCPCEIAAGGPATPEGLPGAKTRARGAGRLTESHTRKPKKMP